MHQAGWKKQNNRLELGFKEGRTTKYNYLNEKEGIAYDAANQYTGNYYDIDVNAALLMNGVEFKNVNIQDKFFTL